MTIKPIRGFQEFNPDHITKQMIFKEDKSQAFVLNFLPGQTLPAHNHPYAHIYLFVVEGEGTCHIDEEKSKIIKGDVIHCSKEEQISIENTGDKNMSVYAVLVREGSAHSK